MAKEWWEDAQVVSDTDAPEAEWWADAPLVDAKPKSRTWDEAISDTGSKIASGVSAVGDELASLRDSFFTGVDNTRASTNTVTTAAQAAQLQKSQDKLAELMSYGEGDSPEAKGLRTTIEHYSKRMPSMVGDMVEAQNDAQRGAAMTTRPAVAAIGEAKTFGEAWDIFKQHPYDVIAGVTATSLPGTVPALVAGAVMGPAAGAAAMGGSSAVTEAGSSIADFARDSGVDTTDRKAVEAFFANRENLADAMSYAGKRAGIIGALDAASGGIAGKTLAPALKSTLARQAVNMPAQMAVQAGLGAGGEAGAQIATKGKIDQPGQVLMEAAGELGGAPMEVAAFSKDARSALTDRKPAPAAPSVVEPTLTPEAAPESTPLQIGNTPDPMIGFPDGTVARRSEVEANIASLPEDQRAAARARMMGLGQQPAKVDPVQSVMAAPSVDEAIAAANAAIESDRSDLDSLVQSETRNLQVLQAQIDQNRIKQNQLAQVHAQSVEALGRLPDQQVAAARAATDETPTAMQLAMQRAQQKEADVSTTPSVQRPVAASGGPGSLDATASVGIGAADGKRLGADAEGSGNSGLAESGVRTNLDAAPALDQRLIPKSKRNVQNAPLPAARTQTQEAAPSEARAPVAGDAAGANGVPAAGTGAKVQPAGVDQRLVAKSKRVDVSTKSAQNPGDGLRQTAQANSGKSSTNGREGISARGIASEYGGQRDLPVDVGAGRADGEPNSSTGVRGVNVASESESLTSAKQGKEVSRYTGKFGKGMGRDAARLEAQHLNRANDGITYTAEEHDDPKLENPYAVVGRKVETPKAAKSKAAEQKQPVALVEPAKTATESVANDAPVSAKEEAPEVGDVATDKVAEKEEKPARSEQTESPNQAAQQSLRKEADADQQTPPAVLQEAPSPEQKTQSRQDVKTPRTVVEESSSSPDDKQNEDAKQEPDTGSDIPPRYFKNTKVDYQVWIEDERTYETTKVSAKDALASIKDDLENYKKLLNCMKG